MADRSRFLLLEVAPSVVGAKVTVAYANEWDTVEATRANRTVKIWAYNRPPLHAEKGISGGRLIARAVIEYEKAHPPVDVDMLGTGVATFEIDYSRWGFTPGQRLYLHGRWPNGHVWGEPWEKIGNGAGTALLPAPLAPALQSRLGSFAAEWRRFGLPVGWRRWRADRLPSTLRARARSYRGSSRRAGPHHR